jgi:hypothetical protein
MRALAVSIRSMEAIRRFNIVLEGMDVANVELDNFGLLLAAAMGRIPN